MEDKARIMKEPGAEVVRLRQQVAQLEEREADRYRAEQVLRRRAEELDALQATILDITAQRDLDSLLETIVVRAARLLGAPGGGLYLCDPAQKQVRCVVSYNTPKDFRGTTLPYGEGAAGTVAQTGEPLIIEDYRSWPGRSAVFDQEQPFRAVLAVPMLWQGQVIGILDIVDFAEDHRFTQADQELLAMFANHAAIAVENTRLYDQAQHEIARREELEQQCKERRLYLEQVLAYAPDAIVAMDAQHRIKEWNPGAEKLFGYSAKEAIGGDVDMLIAAPDATMLEQAIDLTRQAVGGDPVAPTETIRYHKDGTPLDVIVAGAPILVEGKVAGTVAVYTDITQRKRTEDALRENQRRYALAASAGHVGVWDWDLETGAMYLDPNLKAMLGYEDHEIQNHVDAWKRWIHPDDVEWVMAEATIHLEGHTPSLRVARRVRHRDGSFRWFLARGTAIRDLDGKAFRLVGTDSDITERKQAEDALKKAEHEKETILDSLVEHVVHQDLEMRILWANRAACESVGMTRDELIGRTCHEIWAQRRTPCPDCAVLKAMRSGQPHEMETTTPDGRSWYIRGYPVQDERGQIVGGVEITLDISEREQAEYELRRLQELHQEIVHNVNEGIIVQDAEGQITFINPTGARLLGYKSEELEGVHWTRFIPSDQRSIVVGADERRRYGAADRYEVDMVRKDGSRLSVLVSGSPRFDPEAGDYVGTLAIVTDIGERLRAEEAIRQSEERLQQIIQQMPYPVEICAPDGAATMVNQAFLDMFGIPSANLVVGHYNVFADPVLEEMGIVEDIRRVYRGETVVIPEARVLLEKIGTRYQPGRPTSLFQEITMFPVMGKEGQVWQVVTIWKDITDRVQAEEKLMRYAREMEALYETSLEINAQPDLSTLLQAIVRRASELVGTRMGGLYLLRPDGEALELVVSHNLPGDYVGTRLSIGEGLSGRIAKVGEPRMVTDYRVWAGRADVYGDSPFRRVLGVPLKVGERIVGVINVSDDEDAGPFSEEAVRLVSAFADQAAIAIENARLYQEAQQRLAELALLFDTSAAVSTSLDAETVLQATARQITISLEIAECSIYGWDRERDVIVNLVDYSPFQDWWKPETPGTEFPLQDYPVSRKVLAERRPLVIQATDPEADAMELAWMSKERVETVLMVPMVVRDEPVGIMEIIQSSNHGQREFTATEVALCQTLANQAAAALENARLFDAERTAREEAEARAADLRARERYLSTLNDITRTALETPNLGTMLQTLADRLDELLNADSCFITRWDTVRQMAIPAAASGPLRETYPLFEVKPGEATLTESAFRAGGPLVIEDPLKSPLISQRIARQFPVRSALALPLIAGEQKLGAAIITYDSSHRFTAEEIRQGEQAASQVALALAKAQLLETEREQRELAEALRQATVAVSSTLDLEEILDHILEQVERVVPNDAVNVNLVEGDRARIVRWRGYERFGQDVGSIALSLNETHTLHRMQEAGRAVYISDTAVDPAWIRLPEVAWVRSYAGAPIRVRDEVIGFLNADSATPGFYNQDDADRLQAFADQASLAIENARLFQIVEQGKRDWEATFDAMQDAVVLMDRDYRILRANRAFVNLFERPFSQIVGQRYTDVAAGSPCQSKACALEQTIKDGQVHTCMHEYGSRCFELQATYLPGQIAGEVDRDKGTILVLRDITERVEAEKEIHSRNQELALFNRIIGVSAASQDVEPILETVCRELAQHFCVHRCTAALLDKDKKEMVVVAEAKPEDQPSALGQVYPVESNLAAQYMLQHKAPLVVDEAQAVPHLAPIHDLLRRHETVSLLTLPVIGEGDVLGILNLSTREPRTFSKDEVNLVQRVAEQVSGALTRANLEETQRRLSAAVEQAAEAIFITATDGTILYVNPAFERVSGYSRSEAIGQNPRLLKSGEHDRAFYRDLWNTITAGRVWEGRFINRRKDGKFFTEEATITPVRNQAGELVNFVTTMRDVTREVQLEEQFHQAQKMEALGQMAGGIAHDFNNLLTIIHLSTRLLQRQLHPEDPLWEHAQRIQETGERATRLTKQLLSFSRREVVEPELLNLNQVVEDLSRMLQRIIGEDIQLVTDLADDLWPVEMDPTQVDQVVMNLVVNARDAMPEGGTLIIQTGNVVFDDAYASRHVDVHPGEHTMLVISDTGVGMDEEIKAHLFEPFFTTKERGQGTGLGLPTVFGIVTQNGGHIEVDSQPGQGTTIAIYLPVADRTKKPRSAPSRSMTSAETKLVRGTETVLVVEDEQTVRDLAVQVLKSCGYQVLAASNGQDALQINEQHDGPIHLLLTDVVMPQMSGGELANRLQELRPEMRVLYMSGYADDTIIQRGVLSSSAAFVSKPLTIEELTQRVRAVLDGRI